jgi:hypothetical protein
MKKFIGNQPITISNENYKNNVKYYLTYKLDGKRHLYQNGYLITSKLEKIKFNLKTPKDTLLDGELYNGEYYVFDILFYKGKDVRKLKFSERLEILKSIPATKNLTLKEYWYDNVKKDFYEIKNKFTKDMKIGGKVDGIIFTPDDTYYAKVLKWKPINLLSIDFKIHKILPNTFRLLQHDDKTIYTITTVSQKDFNRYKDCTVVEFVYNKGKFIPIRERPDKEHSNYITVIKTNFKQIQTPINMRKLLSS